MVAAFPQLDLQIVEVCIAGIISCQSFYEHLLVLFIQSLIDSLLDVGHLDVYDGLLKRGDGLLHVFLHSSQHVRL
jgi:regulator of sigma D